jgi:hypothetical protein
MVVAILLILHAPFHSTLGRSSSYQCMSGQLSILRLCRQYRWCTLNERGAAAWLSVTIIRREKHRVAASGRVVNRRRLANEGNSKIRKRRLISPVGLVSIFLLMLVQVGPLDFFGRKPANRRRARGGTRQNVNEIHTSASRRQPW